MKNLEDLEKPCPPYNITKEEKHEYRDTAAMFGYINSIKEQQQTIENQNQLLDFCHMGLVVACVDKKSPPMLCPFGIRGHGKPKAAKRDGKQALH